jgi:hypothetical protein
MRRRRQRRTRASRRRSHRLRPWRGYRVIHARRFHQRARPSALILRAITVLSVRYLGQKVPEPEFVQEQEAPREDA